MYGIIYCATNKVSGKVYIGQTTKTIEQRIKTHLRDMKRLNSHFYSALRLYGKEGFIWKTIDSADTKQRLNEIEQYWIKFFEATNKNKGYNLTKGGTGGAQTDKEVLKKMSNASKGKHPSEETKKKIAESSRKSKMGSLNPMFGKIPWNKGKKLGPLSNEQKKFISELHKGRKRSKETGEKISKALTGKPLSDEHKDKIRRIRLGTKATHETRQKMKQSSKNKKPIKCVETNIIYESVNEASNLVHINDTNIRACLKKRQITAGSYHWQYV
jgi:group I intron endonuclease